VIKPVDFKPERKISGRLPDSRRPQEASATLELALESPGIRRCRLRRVMIDFHGSTGMAGLHDSISGDWGASRSRT